VSATTLKLLRAAAEIVGGEEALAERLGISKQLFSRFLSGSQALPDALLLRAVDIILADRLATPKAKGNGAQGIPT
jgi:transcriptional regulator with XRE-family HTH domain